MYVNCINFNKPLTIFNFKIITTRLGDMVAMANERYLYFLHFLDNMYLSHHMRMLQIKTQANITNGNNKIIESIETELGLYFDGKLKDFKTPIKTIGTDFQELAWSALKTINYGEVISYTDQAKIIKKDKSYRATANANSENKLMIVIPCHRVIGNNCKIGGYSGGQSRKKWMISFEQINKNNK